VSPLKQVLLLLSTGPSKHHHRKVEQSSVLAPGTTDLDSRTEHVAQAYATTQLDSQACPRPADDAQRNARMQMVSRPPADEPLFPLPGQSNMLPPPASKPGAASAVPAPVPGPPQDAPLDTVVHSTAPERPPTAPSHAAAGLHLDISVAGSEQALFPASGQSSKSTALTEGTASGTALVDPASASNTPVHFSAPPLAASVSVLPSDFSFAALTQDGPSSGVTQIVGANPHEP
jgi:hypothetical protein